ncbi:hypothetical protein ACKA06_10925 [Rossellomorea oryzaecorticis]|uniref:Uncharacterized protein n=1 Tax=Rossellomorea oryzaecorticis TaxID=1396505 RepID=A0ABW8VQN8_9BACI|nr:hypothetical protein KJK41_03930 [Bacillus haikouensis]
MKKKIKVTYNVSVMLIALLLGLRTYPGEWSNFFFLVVGLGFFFTLGIIVQGNSKHSK